MTCPSCGNENSAGGVFCMRCGAPLQQNVGEQRPQPAASPAGGPPPPEFAFATAPEYAGFWIRFFAYMIDSIIIIIAMTIVILPVSVLLGIALGAGQAAAGSIDEDALGGLLALFLYPLIFGIMWLYQALFLSSARQATLGKMALGLIVTDLEGGRLSFGRASGRFFGSILSGFILNIGYLIQPFTAKKQALHDMLAGTLVVRKR